MFRIPGVLFHTLRGRPGWSSFQRTKIDVARVVAMHPRRRWFRLFDRKLPYTLNIVYYFPQTEVGLSPGFSLKGDTVFTLYNQTVTENLLTRRYPSEADARAEMAAIHDKMARLDKYQQKLVRELTKNDG